MIDPTRQRSLSIGKTSYIAAGLLGAAYFAVKAGRVRLLDALILNLACLLALAVLVFGSSVLPPHQQFLSVLAGAPAVLIFQSVRMVALVRSSYRRRQWSVRLAD